MVGEAPAPATKHASTLRCDGRASRATANSSWSRANWRFGLALKCPKAPTQPKGLMKRAPTQIGLLVRRCFHNGDSFPGWARSPRGSVAFGPPLSCPHAQNPKPVFRSRPFGATPTRRFAAAVASGRIRICLELKVLGVWGGAAKPKAFKPPTCGLWENVQHRDQQIMQNNRN